MIPTGQHKGHVAGRPIVIDWRGQSGRTYALVSEPLDLFTLHDDKLYLLVENGTPLWAGSAREIIDDHTSRSAFRAAISRADSVLRIKAPADAVERVKLKCDLETGRRAGALALVS